VRRLIAGEALIVSVVAGALGILAGRPLADAIVSILAEHATVPAGFGPGSSWIPLVAAFGGGILVAQVAVFAAARRAGRTRPAEALREAVIERARPGILQLLTGLACLGGGVAMALIFKGTWALAFAILEGSCSRSVSACSAAPCSACRRRCSPTRCAGSAPRACSPERAWPPTAGGRPRSPHRSCSSRCWPGSRASSRTAAGATPRRSPPSA
jgi:predicted lysophospholipase L1 biosynthesis ABC-type transport system permease subunit